jgi:hypothetical protein
MQDEVSRFKAAVKSIYLEVLKAGVDHIRQDLRPTPDQHKAWCLRYAHSQARKILETADPSDLILADPDFLRELDELGPDGTGESLESAFRRWREEADRLQRAARTA